MFFQRAAIAAEGYDPDDPAVAAALDRISAVLAELGRPACEWRPMPFWDYM